MCVRVWVCATHVCMHVWWHIENKPEITVETERKRENFGIRNEIRVLRNFLWDLIFHDEARYWRAQHTCLSVCVFCPLVLLPRIALSIFRFQYFLPNLFSYASVPEQTSNFIPRGSHHSLLLVLFSRFSYDLWIELANNEWFKTKFRVLIKNLYMRA